MTLFTTGLIKPVDIDCKHFEDLILNSFRNINAKIVQVIVKSGYGHLFTAKIYLADEESGK
jgi:bifunctional DNase/RNase